MHCHKLNAYQNYSLKSSSMMANPRQFRNCV